MLVANPDQSDLNIVIPLDLSLVSEAYGPRESPELPLFAIQDETTAKEIAGYIAHEGLRIAPLFRIIGVPWWEAYDLEVGDIVTVTTPWKNATYECRIIEYVKNFQTEQVDFRLVGVRGFQSLVDSWELAIDITAGAGGAIGSTTNISPIIAGG